LPDNYRFYYQELIAQLAARNVLHLYILEVNSRPIASAFGYEEGATFQYAKAGYDEQYAEISPSNLLLIHIIEHLMAAFPEIKRFHLFPWDYGYKHRFINEKSEYTETNLYSSTARGRLAYTYEQMKNKVRDDYPELFNRAKKILKRV